MKILDKQKVSEREKKETEKHCFIFGKYFERYLSPVSLDIARAFVLFSVSWSGSRKRIVRSSDY